MARFAFALAAVSMIAVPAMAAKPCKDAKGKFIKCPPAPVATAKPATVVKPAPTAKPAKPAAKTTGRCRNAKGQFAKCGTPGAKPA